MALERICRNGDGFRESRMIFRGDKEEMDEFYNKIQKQLKRMTEAEKDSWILSQAKILPTWEQEDFYKSICGTKKVINMPEREEISAFCEKVRDGDIFVEYETHYVEFDDYGHFHDDWEHDFYDPKHAMSFISSVIRGCHDLIVLEEYEDAFQILDDIIGLEFVITDHPDTDDTCEDEYMDLDMAVHEGILSLNRDDILRDYIKSCRESSKDDKYVAEKIVNAFEMELFKDCKIYNCITINEKDPLLKELKKKLGEERKRLEKDFSEKSKKDKYYWGEFRDKERIRHVNTLIEYFGKIGKKEEKPKESFLRGTWSQISNLISELMDEPYIDDQFQIEEIWNIVEALLKRGGFDKEPWEVKQHILEEIYENDFFDYYGVYDPMKDLAGAICSSREENIKRAEIMMKAGRGYLGAEAAKLYREMGEDDKCAEYFDNHLGKEEEPYEILIDYYKERDHEKAVVIATQAIQKCKKDQTPFFLFLLQDAKDRCDETAFKKLMQSAHRRRAVKSAEVDERFS